MKHRAVAILFFAALWTPFAGLFFHAGQLRPADENRTPAPAPGIANWRAFTAYFDDHFGFRGALITAQAALKVNVLGVSTSPDVVIGKQGWLFYAGEKSMESYRGVLPFAPGELTAWVRFFKRQNDWLARRGIRLLVVIVPDKQTVYPEFLPSTIRKVTPHTRLDELTAEIDAIDLRSTLRNAKASDRELYFRRDSHWSPQGVYAAYREILRSLPALRPIPFVEPPPASQYQAGDLTKILGLANLWRDLPNPFFNTPTAPSNEARILALGDSFLPPLSDYLGAHLERSNTLTPEFISDYHPKIILLEMVERKLNHLPPPLNPAIGEDH